jgi:hypothetical protein
LREASNRTFQRILAGLPAEVARRYGSSEAPAGAEDRLRQVITAKDWKAVAELSAELAREAQQPAG